MQSLKNPVPELHFTRAIIFQPPWRTSELGWIKVPHSCRHERHVLVSVSDFRSFFTRTQNIPAKKQFKERFQSNGTVSFPSNNRPRPKRICFEVICTTNTSSVRSGLAFFHTYSLKMVTGNTTLRAYSPWWKFTKVSGGSAFLCMKRYILEYNNDSKFGLDTFNESYIALLMNGNDPQPIKLCSAISWGLVCAWGRLKK